MDKCNFETFTQLQNLFVAYYVHSNSILITYMHIPTNPLQDLVLNTG